MKRLAQLLDIGIDEAEEELCEVINQKMVVCKIDRVDGIINFHLPKNENIKLNEFRRKDSKPEIEKTENKIFSNPNSSLFFDSSNVLTQEQINKNYEED